MTSKHSELTIFPADLILRDDDLSTVGIIGTRDRVLEDTDSADDLALLDDTLLALCRLAGAEVARVADNLLGLDSLITAADTDEIAVLVGDDLINSLVEHVGATIDGAETGERLGKLAKTIERVDVW